MITENHEYYLLWRVNGG